MGRPVVGCCGVKWICGESIPPRYSSFEVCVMITLFFQIASLSRFPILCRWENLLSLHILLQADSRCQTRRGRTLMALGTTWRRL